MKNNTQSVRIIRNLLNEYDFYSININGIIPLTLNCTNWDKNTLNYKINQIGMIFSEVFIHSSKIEFCKSLDDFMISVRSNEGCSTENIINYPFKKGEKLRIDDFEEKFKLYFKEIFLDNEGNLITIDFSKYKEGYLYFNELSVIVMGCLIDDFYWGFTYLPYI